MDKKRIIIGFIVGYICIFIVWAAGRMWDNIEKINESMDFTINALKNIYTDQKIFYTNQYAFRIIDRHGGTIEPDSHFANIDRWDATDYQNKSLPDSEIWFKVWKYEQRNLKDKNNINRFNSTIQKMGEAVECDKRNGITLGCN